MRFGTQNNHAMQEKCNNKYQCKFLLTCIVKVHREVFLRLHNLEI
jgi:hypothetical protein